MTTAKIVAIIICTFSCLVHVKCEKSTEESLEIEDIDNLFEIGDRAVDLNGQEDVILLIGGTGTGKSTLSKFLRQDKSLKVTQNEADDFVFTDGEEKIGNEDNHLSKTLFPLVDKDVESGAFIVDCAGFEDTRHPMYDLLASFFTQKVFNKAHNMKIIVVESFERMRLSSDRTAFMRSIKQLARLLEDNVTAFNGSIGLVATKVDSSRPDDQLEKSVNVFLKATLMSLKKKKNDAKKRDEISEVVLLERQIVLIQFLATGDKVAIFRRPNDLRSPWNQPLLKNNFNQIRDLMFKNLFYLETNKKSFHVSVAPETVIYIQNDLFTAAEENLQRILTDIANTLILDFETDVEKEKSAFLREDLIATKNFTWSYEAQLEKVNSTHSLLHYFRQNNINASLLQEVDLEMRKVDFLCSVVGSDVDTFRKQVVAMYGNWAKILANVDANRKYFNAATLAVEKSGSYAIYANPPFLPNVTSDNYADFITYVLSLNFDTPTFLAASNINPTPKQIHTLNRIKAEKMNQSIATQKSDHDTKYSGNYILASQIQSPEIIRGHLVIMAAQKFFVDKDLTLTNTHLTIMAPIVEVVGENRTLILKGSNGVSFSSAAAAGLKGQDGKPGFSSGDIKIYALDVVNAHLLTVRSIGGDGSDGQAGGRGTDGVTSSLPGLVSLRGHEDDVFSDIRNSGYKMDGWRTLNENVNNKVFNEFKYVDRELTVTNTQGRQSPTNGGDGGHGGAAALPGDVKIELKNAATQIATESVIGKSGKGGLGGTAGHDAATCAYAVFHCHGWKTYKTVLWVKLNNPSFKYRCSLVKKEICGSKLPSARNGIIGLRLPNLKTRSHKLPVATSTKKQVQEHCEIAETSAALEKDGKVNEFLDFIVSLPNLEM